MKNPHVITYTEQIFHVKYAYYQPENKMYCYQDEIRGTEDHGLKSNKQINILWISAYTDKDGRDIRIPVFLTP